VTPVFEPNPNTIWADNPLCEIIPRIAAPQLCSPLMAWLCEAGCEGATTAVSVARNADNLIKLIFSFFFDPVGTSLKQILIIMLSWLAIPTRGLFDTSEGSVSSTIQTTFILPIVIVLLVCGIIWQGFRMVISRRGAPLIRVAKALLATAAVGALATAATAVLLDAGDRYSCWVLGEALRGANSDNPNKLFTEGHCVEAGLITTVMETDAVDKLAHYLKIPASLTFVSGVGIVIPVFLNLFMLLAALVQTFLLTIRSGSLVILAGVAQLAAAGKITSTTSPWLMRAVGWGGALIFYKPAAATVYATSFLLLDDAGNGSHAEMSNFVMGLTMLVLALFAMPALMRFFSWGFSALGRDGSLAGAATGLDNLADDAIRVGNDLRSNARRQATSIDNSLPLAEVETRVLMTQRSAASARSAGVVGGSARAGAAAGAGGGGGGGAGAGAAAGAGALGAAAGGANAGTAGTTAVATTTTLYSTAAAGGAAAAPATGGASLIIAGTVIGSAAAATQVGASLKRTVTNHMDEDNE